MVSPANTYVCLTEGGPGCADDEPDKYYPAGTRNYARVVAHDAYQGAALAEFMQAQGTTKLYILNDKEAYGLGVATNTRNAAEHLGIEVVGFDAWDPKASNYEALMNKIKQSGADGVFLGGLIDENGAQVIKDKVKVLGPNDGVKLYMPDGFTTQQTIDEAGVENTRGAFFSVAGIPVEEFQGSAQEFITTFQETPGRRARRPVRGLRRAGGSDPARRDRRVGLQPRRRHRQAVRDPGRGRLPRRLRDQRERRPVSRERRGRRLHDLPRRGSSSRPRRCSRLRTRTSRLRGARSNSLTTRGRASALPRLSSR